MVLLLYIYSKLKKMSLDAGTILQKKNPYLLVSSQSMFSFFFSGSYVPPYDGDLTPHPTPTHTFLLFFFKERDWLSSSDFRGIGRCSLSILSRS